MIRSEEAYLLGAYLSDGHLRWDLNSPHPVWNVSDEPFADCISIALSKVNSPHAFRQYFYTWKLRKRYWQVEEYAKGRFGLWLAGIAPEKNYLPKVPKKSVRSLIAGLMDGDGSFGLGGLSFAGSKGFVLDFYTLLQSLGVKVSEKIGRQGSCYYWYINVETYLAAGLNFAMPRKQARLACWCNKIHRRALLRGRSDDLRKASIAKWWMREVYSRAILVPIPTEYYTFKGVK